MQLFSFFDTSTPFENWNLTHKLAIVISMVVAIIAIVYGKKLDRAGQKRLLMWLTVIPFLGMWTSFFMKLGLGAFDIKKDLPMHLCRFLAMMAPLVYWKESKFWTGVFYFWIVVGALNAALTPELIYDFPHWQSIVYFILHLGLVILPFYYIIVMGHRLTWKDLWNTFWMANLFLLISLVVNYFLGSNYMYTMGKPEVASLFDVLGPWPWYLVSIQFLALVLFFLVFIPFLFLSKKSSE